MLRAVHFMRASRGRPLRTVPRLNGLFAALGVVTAEALLYLVLSPPAAGDTKADAAFWIIIGFLAVSVALAAAGALLRKAGSSRAV